MKFNSDQAQQIENLVARIALVRGNRRHGHLPSDVKRAALSLIAEGLSVYELARAIGVSKSCVYGWQQSQRVTRARRRHPENNPVVPAPAPRVLAVRNESDVVVAQTQCLEQRAIQSEATTSTRGPQTLRMQLGGFDINISWRGNTAEAC